MLRTCDRKEGREDWLAGCGAVRILKSSVLQSAPPTFLVVGGLPVHCKRLSGIPGLYTLDAGSTTTLQSSDEQPCLQILPKVSLVGKGAEENIIPFGNHCSIIIIIARMCS